MQREKDLEGELAKLREDAIEAQSELDKRAQIAVCLSSRLYHMQQEFKQQVNKFEQQVNGSGMQSAGHSVVMSGSSPKPSKIQLHTSTTPMATVPITSPSVA